jgi:D-alanyl-D-alanine carboxypeptidase/D-alanyl-D-alanine-endopeptidase (penicillin-binding protein 4)
LAEILAMVRLVCFFFTFISFFFAHAQDPALSLKKAIDALEKDPMLKHGIIALRVVDLNTGKVLFSHNDETGLAVASSQKVFTSAAAFELLGSAYRFKTELGYSGNIDGGILKGDIYVLGSGDPTLGSWRYENTRDSIILKEWVRDIRQSGIKRIEGTVKYDMSRFSKQTIPGGWIWEDLGNYYGAGSGAINWHENQYDLLMRSGNREGDSVVIIENAQARIEGPFYNELSAGSAASGDNAYIFLPLGNAEGYIRGTIPAGEKKFPVSGAMSNPSETLSASLKQVLALNQIGISDRTENKGDGMIISDSNKPGLKILSTHFSPPMDSVVYWFLKRSINLYGEALVKCLALEKKGWASTEDGVQLLVDFWNEKGIEESAIHLIDGSGLSPQNRVTADALVQVMQYATKQPWFDAFYDALPLINGLKMKSGSINGARSFTGYVHTKRGKDYCFAIVANNYDGSASAMVRKMYSVLDILK